jgi:DNA helicase-2/ATP-dependent DNA helicase PcrA
LANYQERFQYILVDEYQDTSGSQNKLVELLINFWENPNIFVVGDDDQSIFRFQGANVENMLHFAKKYDKEILKVVLSNNYRSTQPILETSKAIIKLNNDRLVNKIEGLEKELVSSNKDISHLNHLPVIVEYETQRNEMIGVVTKCKEILAKGIVPGKIGIIYKENKYGETLTQYFNLLDIPVFSKRNMNALELPLARKIILMLKYLASEQFIPFSGDQLLFEILHFDWFNILPLEVAKITMEVADRRFQQNKTSLRELMQVKINTPANDLFSSNITEEMAKASKLVENLIAAVPNVTLQMLFEQIIRETGIIASIMQHDDKHWQLQILTALFDFVKEETHRNPLMSLQELVTLIELMEKENISIPLVQVSGSDKGINLMTAHGSKGLEFEYVFIVGCNADLWEKKKVTNRGYKIPPTVFISSTNTKDNEELRRLFYVGITRAEQHLYISYSKFKNDGKEIEPSMFLAEIQNSFQLPVEKIQINNENAAAFAALNFGEGAKPEIGKLEDDLITPLLDKFVMNVTALNSYLKCPLSFYYNNFIRIPSAKNEATEFGSAIHFALEHFFEKMIADPNRIFPDKEVLLASFEFYMNRHRESFSKEQFTRRMEYGNEVLANYHHKYHNSFNKYVVNEISIKGVVVNGVPIKGKLDKLEFTGNAVNVVDYKSGNPENGIKKLKGPNDKEPNGGDYWRQAVFYKILVDNKPGKDWVVQSTEFDFIEPDSKKRYLKEKVNISAADVTTVTQQITETWNKIKNREFYTGCGKADCMWCEFVKGNKLAIQLHFDDADKDDI